MEFSLLDVYLCPSSGYGYLLGVKEDRTTVGVRLSGYRPYFYAHNPSIDKDKDRVQLWGETLSMNEKMIEFVANDKGSLIGIDIVNQKLLFGYSAEAPYMLKIYCQNAGAVKKCAKVIQDLGNKTYEHDKDMRLAFLRENNLTMCGTISISAAATVGKSHQQPFSRCDHEYYANLNDIHCKPYETFPPLIVAAYDIETTGLNGDQDSVFQVSICIRNFPFFSDNVRKIIVSTIPMSDGDGDFEIIIVKDEKGLIEKFVEILVQERVTFLCAWNNLGFDAPFLNKRAKKFRCSNAIQRMSFLLPHVCQLRLREKSLNSSAFGTNNFFVYQGLHGLTEVDGLLMARKSSSLKLNSYKLNNVARELLNSAKDDVSYEYLFDAVKKRDPDMIYKVAKYCVQDSLLVLQIFQHLKDVDNMLVMSSLTNIPMSYICERGQSVKCESLIRMEAFRQNMIWHKPPPPPPDQTYQGSTVIDSITGLYLDPVSVMDFNSLYPSIIMAYSLSPETFVKTEKRDWNGRDEDLAFYENGCLYVYIGSKTFAVFNNLHIDTPVVPTILRVLIAERKAVRREMAKLAPDDKLAYSQLDAKQLALKILSNSIYGALGFGNGPMPVVEIAASTTAIGRMSIRKVQNALAEHGYPDVIAGDTDSVMVLIKGVSIKDAIAISSRLCTEVLNPLFPPPMKIEFEKVLCPDLVFNKKRYCSLSYEDPDKPPKMLIKGIACKRRDNAIIVSKTTRGILEIILWKQDIQMAADYFKDVLQKLSQNQVPVEEFVIRKELKRLPQNYVHPTPHSAAVARLIERNPDEAPRLGDRVPYVVTTGPGEVVDRTEDPRYAKDIDRLYYLTNQLKNPVFEIFRAVNNKAILKELEKVYAECFRTIDSSQKGQRRITDFFLKR